MGNRDGGFFRARREAFHMKFLAFTFMLCGLVFGLIAVAAMCAAQ
jgi:hypothetical protein